MRFSAAALALFLLVAITASVHAQRGVIRGRVTDASRASIPYANIVVIGSQIGAMTDTAGTYSLEVPVGENRVLATVIGFAELVQTVRIGSGETIALDFVLQQSRPKSIESIDVKRDPVAPRVAEEQLRDFPNYSASTAPVLRNGVEFQMRYVLTQERDSVVVNVIAEGRNPGKSPIETCGCLSFWRVQYQLSSEVMEHVRLGPADRSLVYPIYPWLAIPAQDCSSAVFDCETKLLAPGEKFEKVMSFFFYPRAFTNWAGGVEIQCYFFEGSDEQSWRDVSRFDVGTVTVPIRPIGQSPRKP